MLPTHIWEEEKETPHQQPEPQAYSVKMLKQQPCTKNLLQNKFQMSLEDSLKKIGFYGRNLNFLLSYCEIIYIYYQSLNAPRLAQSCYTGRIPKPNLTNVTCNDDADTGRQKYARAIRLKILSKITKEQKAVYFKLEAIFLKTCESPTNILIQDVVYLKKHAPHLLQIIKDYIS